MKKIRKQGLSFLVTVTITAGMMLSVSGVSTVLAKQELSAVGCNTTINMAGMNIWKPPVL